MKITVLGWYGTETLGDRAIMAGLIRLFSISYNDVIHLYWGSLFCPLTERSLYEDTSFYKEISNHLYDDQSAVFYSLNRNELERYIEKSDLVIVGGGPLIDLHAMYMINYAFEYAKKKGIATALMGCGWGPLLTTEYIKVTKNLIMNSDCVIFRDNNSLNACIKHIDKSIKAKPIAIIDPAVFAALYYKSSRGNQVNKSHISANFRELFVVEDAGNNRFTYSDCCKVIRQVLDLNLDLPIRLVPMHTFHIGGDDRIVLNKIAFLLNSPNIIVENEPLSLKKLLEVYCDSVMSIGMRFHAVLLQTILNGRNIVLDYTESKTGKIASLLQQLDIEAQYSKRYVSCEKIKELHITDIPEQAVLDEAQFDMFEQQYINAIKAI